MICHAFFAFDHLWRKAHSGQFLKMSVSRICLAWFYELFVGMLISLTNAYAVCGRPILNCMECIDVGLLSGCHEDQRHCRTNDIRFISKL